MAASAAADAARASQQHASGNTQEALSREAAVRKHPQLDSFDQDTAPRMTKDAIFVTVLAEAERIRLERLKVCQQI